MKKTISLSKLHPDATISGAVYPHDVLLGLLGERLKLGIVHFSYKRTDGNSREAYGTLEPSYFPPKPPPVEGAAPKKERQPNPNLVSYFDLGVKEWRSFKIENLQAVF